MSQKTLTKPNGLNKTFNCDKKHYIFEKYIMSIFYIIFLICSSYLIWINMLRIPMVLVFLTSLYSIFKSMIIDTYVTKIHFNNNKIVINRGQKTNIYHTKDIKEIKLKQNKLDYIIKLHIKDHKLNRYRYDLDIAYFDNKDDLVYELKKFIKEIK